MLTYNLLVTACTKAGCWLYTYVGPGAGWTEAACKVAGKYLAAQLNHPNVLPDVLNAVATCVVGGRAL